MRTRFTTAILGSVLVLGLSPLARAGDPPAEDPASMLRRARVTETVDHDLPKAMDLYRKVFAAAGDSDTSRDAALHLMDLLEARGDRPGALEFAKALTDRFGSRLDDTMKRQVHETMARTLPAGSHAKSPLGDVYVLPAPGSASNPAPSPLETKILAILSRLDVVEDKERNNVEVSVLSALAPVGRDALPVLERVMNDSRPERARFAAQAFAKIGQKDAIPGLVKAIREGDGFARASAVGGLAMVEANASTSPALVAAIEPLLGLASLAELRGRLIQQLAKHLGAAACLDRFERGGDDARQWLYEAASRDGMATAERLLKSAAGPSGLPADLVASAGRVAGLRKDVWNGNEYTWTPEDPAVPGATRQGLLAAVVKGPASAASVAAAASIAGAIRRTGSPTEQTAASASAWGFALDAKDVDLVEQGVADLARYGVEPAVETLASAPRAAAFQTALATICLSNTGERSTLLRTLFQPALFGSPVLWAVLERAIDTGTVDADPMTSLINRIREVIGSDLPPPTEDARWLRVLEGHPALEPYIDQPSLSWMRRAAARPGDPRILEIARARNRTQGVKNNAVVQSWCFDLEAVYRGPGRGAFALDVIATFAIDWGVVGWAKDDPEFWPLLAKRLGEYGPNERGRVLSVLSGLVRADSPPPPEFDALWLAELRRHVNIGSAIVQGFVAAAARSGSPEYAAIVKELLLKWKEAPSAIPRAHGGRRSRRTRAPTAGRCWSNSSPTRSTTARGRATSRLLVWRALNADPDTASLAPALDAIAKNPLAPGNDRAVWRLASPGRTAELVELYRTLEKPGTAMRLDYRIQLANIAKSLHLKEAIPFLLKEYREGQSFATPALDEIRTYYDRLKAFEGFADGKDPLTAEIEAAKTGPTVELRRAAVFALAATHGVKAVPALLDIARTTADEPVRKAAIEMIEQIARGTAAGEPAGTAKPPAPAAPSVPAPAPTPGVDEPPTEK